MSSLEANLRALRRRHPTLAQELGAAPHDSALRCTSRCPEILPTRSGAPTCRHRGLTLHSAFDPVREARRLIEKEVDDGSSLVVFFGFGLGYYVEAFVRLFPQHTALVIEPDLGLFQLALSVRPLQGLLAHPRLSFFVGAGQAALPETLDELPLARVNIIKPRSLLLTNPGYYTQTEGVIRSYLSRKKLNVNTLRRFGRLWVRNLVRNMDRMSAPGVRELVGIFSGLPALVLGSGPSLDGILLRLGELRRKLLIISVDTSLRACLERSVEPDFVIVVDPQYWNTRHLDGVAVQSSVLLSESATHPRVFRVLNLPVFFGSSFFPLGRFFETVFGEKGKLGAGGSVATSAWDLARQLGCRPIYMAGLDLGFPGRSTHFRGATFETRFAAASGRLKPSETMSFAYLHDASPFPVSANTAGAVLTDQRMLIYKWWFEDQMKSRPEAETRNLSPAGARIEGMPYSDAEQLDSLPDRREEIDRLMTRVKRIAGKTGRQAPDVAGVVQNLTAELRKLVDLSSTGLRALDELEQRLKAGLDTAGVKQILNGVDRRILEAGSRAVVSFLLQPLITDILHDDGWNRRKTANTVLDTSRELYRQIRESSSFHLALFERRFAHGGV